jgi:RNA polymerase sigma-70 factor (ECF subfamily)
MFMNLRSQKTDEELMRLVQQGDQRALTELYARYAKKLVRYFHRMMWRDDDKAQDFLHDLFVKIIEKPEQFKPDKKFSTWIYSVAFNMCKNEYRRQSVRQASQIETVDDRSKNPEAALDGKEFLETLDRLLNQSEESDRNLFVLRYELDMRLSEIAAILDCPEGTVKSRIFYLKRKLALDLRAFNPAIN